VVQDGSDALLRVDRDAAGSTHAFTTLIRLQNVDGESLSLDNFNPAYPPDGSGIIGTTVNGTGGADLLSGTIGDDIISGLAGADSLSGGNGSDRLIGGADPDTLTGGFGADMFVLTAVNDGVDTITDFTAGPNLPFGDQLEISASTFGGGLVAGGTIQLVSGADPLTWRFPFRRRWSRCRHGVLGRERRHPGGRSGTGQTNGRHRAQRI
jgi:Ca2+-binding RTX toxin-like protein